MPQNLAYDVTIRRLATGADFSIRLFAKDASTAAERATHQARRSFGIRTKETDHAHTRVVLCNVSDNQTRPGDT
jgi:hypothetical protein